MLRVYNLALSPQVKFPLGSSAETPKTAAHFIEYAHLIKWDEEVI